MRNLTRVLSTGAAAFFVFSCASTSRVSHRDLDLLEVHRWTLPLPKDARFIWSFEIRDATERDQQLVGGDEWMDHGKAARITFMPTGEGANYRFWLEQRDGTSSGVTRVDPCPEPDDVTIQCPDAYETEWFRRAVRIGDGKTYAIGEVRDASSGRRRRVVLYLTKYRLEDMLEDAGQPPNSRLNPPLGPSRRLQKAASAAPAPRAG